jgi:exopolysaccharide biosynthesis polyprenyl glycosylphosphotransferase
MATASAVRAGGAPGAHRVGRRDAAALLLIGAAVDALAVGAAVAFGVAADWLHRPATLVAAAGMAVTLAALASIRRGRRKLRGSLYDDLGAVGAAVPVALFVGVIMQALVADRPAPGVTPLVLVTGLAVVALVVSSSLTQKVAVRAVRPVPTLIVGAGTVGRLVAQRLIDNSSLGLEPVGFLDKDPLAADGLQPGFVLPVLGASWDLEEVVREHDVGYVIVTFSTAPTEVLLSLLRRCEALRLNVALVPRLFERVPKRVDIHHLGALPLLQVRPSNPKGFAFTLKHVFDRVLAALLVPILAPALITTALAVWVSLGRPILFRQRRIGRDGKPFDMLKFRTMHPPRSDGATNGRTFVAPGLAPGGVEGVDRRSPVGAILRRTSLDELPQLFNVLKGEMSFVGPRPERPEFVELFNDGVYRYADRHRAKAGITGWSQVNGLRGKTSIQDRAEWDNYYIENWSFGMDLRILALTFRTMFLPGASE